MAKVEILNIFRFGLWFLARGKEYFLSYEAYPWFQDAKIAPIYHFEVSTSGRAIYWPDLDIDLEIESLEHPEKYPLTSKTSAPSSALASKKRRKKAA